MLAYLRGLQSSLGGRRLNPVLDRWRVIDNVSRQVALDGDVCRQPAVRPDARADKLVGVVDLSLAIQLASRIEANTAVAGLILDRLNAAVALETTFEELSFRDAQKTPLHGCEELVVRWLLVRFNGLVVNNAAESVQQLCNLGHVQLARLRGRRGEHALRGL